MSGQCLGICTMPVDSWKTTAPLQCIEIFPMTRKDWNLLWRLRITFVCMHSMDALCNFVTHYRRVFRSHYSMEQGRNLLRTDLQKIWLAWKGQESCWTWKDVRSRVLSCLCVGLPETSWWRLAQPLRVRGHLSTLNSLAEPDVWGTPPDGLDEISSSSTRLKFRKSPCPKIMRHRTGPTQVSRDTCRHRTPRLTFVGRQAVDLKQSHCIQSSRVLIGNLKFTSISEELANDHNFWRLIHQVWPHHDSTRNI